jgi:hypothetical protein
MPLCICRLCDSLGTLGLNDTNAATSYIPESHVESTEFRTNDQEDSKRFVWVLDVGKERSIETEGNGDFGRLIEVGLEDVSNRGFIYELAV